MSRAMEKGKTAILGLGEPSLLGKTASFSTEGDVPQVL